MENLREINIGNIPSGILYRSCHPICDGRQVKDIILQANKVKIKTVLNLSDSIQSLKNKSMCCPWYSNLIKENNVIALDIRKYNDIMDKTFTKKIKQCLLFIITHEPPYLMHCEAGIDRTGFLSLLLESFMGASLDDIVKDYLLSFIDKNEISKYDLFEGTNIIKNILGEMKGKLLDKNDNLIEISEKYIFNIVGLSENEKNILRDKLKNVKN